MSELLKRIQTGQRHIAEYARPNADFICPVCKQESPCYASFVTLQAGYGSVHDGEKAKVRVCGDCVDQLFKRLEVKPANKKSSPKQDLSEEKFTGSR